MCSHVYHALRCTHHNVIPPVPLISLQCVHMCTALSGPIHTSTHHGSHLFMAILIMLCHTRTNTTLYLIHIVPRFLSAPLGNSQYMHIRMALSGPIHVYTLVWPSLALFTHP